MDLFLPSAPQVNGLDHTSQVILDSAWKQWAAKLPRNIERLFYFDGKNKLKDLRIAIPPELRDKLDVVMGWAEKSVTEPANRTVFEGMLDDDLNEDPFDLAWVMHQNRFAVELPQAVRASMTYSCAFQSVTPGDVASGDPEVMMMFHSAMWATGLWDRRKRALSAGLLINSTDANGAPTKFTLMLPLETVICVKGPKSWYVERVVPNVARRVTLELFPFAPDLDRPFGRARIDRRVMSITDRAVRAGSRLDVHSELFSAMKLILLGVDDSAFTDESGKQIPMWQSYMSRMNVLSRDEEGELPTIEQISAESPEPHIATMRQLASEFSGHTGVPLGSLGIAQDQPESADAKNVAREDIIFMVEQQHKVYGHSMLRSFENAVMIRDGLSEPPRDIHKVELLWRRPDKASEAALADAGMKQVTAAGIEGTETGMAMAGMSRHQIRRVKSELERKSSGSVLDRVIAGATPEVDPAAAESEEAVRNAQTIKAQFDALGVGVRAGVDPDAAAERIGLQGIKFTGATPVSLRQPTSAAEELEDR